MTGTARCDSFSITRTRPFAWARREEQSSKRTYSVRRSAETLAQIFQQLTSNI
ncbi:MAG: hypothetical protein WKF84_21635 [Pyrinomonadaceae bacterium]